MVLRDSLVALAIRTASFKNSTAALGMTILSALDNTPEKLRAFLQAGTDHQREIAKLVLSKTGMSSAPPKH